MGTPLFNILVFLVLTTLATMLFWPRSGFIPRLREQSRAAGRTRLEDALKHIYHQENQGQTTTLASLGGALEISSAQTVALVGRLDKTNLARFADGRILLTEDGQRYALQVIRAHRLWERYLADETGVNPLDWHVQAERREHSITPEQANELSERLGNPRFDPHGDPIPTAEGAVPERSLTPLTELEPGTHGRVVHIEDEPGVVYAELLAQGIYLGMKLHVEEKTERRIVFSADGKTFAMAPIVAANVSMQTTTEERDRPSGGEIAHSLLDLEPGQVVEVVKISPACRGIERRRLMDLGIVPGTKIEFERPGMTGGLSAYRVRGTVIALRQEQAAMVAVETRRLDAESEPGRASR